MRNRASPQHDAMPAGDFDSKVGASSRSAILAGDLDLEDGPNSQVRHTTVLHEDEHEGKTLPSDCLQRVRLSSTRSDPVLQHRDPDALRAREREPRMSTQRVQTPCTSHKLPALAAPCTPCSLQSRRSLRSPL